MKAQADPKTEWSPGRAATGRLTLPLAKQLTDSPAVYTVRTLHAGPLPIRWGEGAGRAGEGGGGVYPSDSSVAARYLNRTRSVVGSPLVGQAGLKSRDQPVRSEGGAWCLFKRLNTPAWTCCEGLVPSPGPDGSAWARGRAGGVGGGCELWGHHLLSSIGDLLRGVEEDPRP